MQYALSLLFYEDEAVNRTEASTGRMTTETVDCLIQQAFAALDNRNSSVTFAFQGGEQHLLGWITTVILLKRFTSITQTTST